MDAIVRDRGRIAALSAALWAVGLSSCALSPRTDRDWHPYLANTAHVEADDGRISIAPVIDWSYDSSGPTETCLREASFEVGEMTDVWFMIEPQPGSRLAAHTLLLFEFEGDRLLGLTIEARREADETYSAWRGLWNAYELSYVWATARDLLTRRAVMLGHEVYVYPLSITDDQEKMLLQNLIARTEALETQPRFYNTLFSNCTNELAKAAGIRWHYSFLLTGKSDDHLFRAGTIPGASFEEAQAKADVTELVRTLNDADPASFDAALLAELRARRDGAAEAAAE